MKKLILNFENDLQTKIEQKSGTYASLDACLIKIFKYFDLNNSGNLNKKEFIKALDKIGMSYFSNKEIDLIFNYYDANKNGVIDYKEFSQNLLFKNKVSKSISKKSNLQSTNEELVQEFFFNLAIEIRKNGILGIFLFGRLFRIEDTDNTRFCDFKTFLNIVKEVNEDFDNETIKISFDFFDRNGNGLINYDEVLIALRGAMPHYRVKLVNRVFNGLSQDQDGLADIEDFKKIFNPSNHPEVLNKKTKPEKIGQEFICSVEYFYDIKGFMDGKISKDEFEEFYSFISFNYDNDKDFESILRNCWDFNEEVSYSKTKNSSLYSLSKKDLKNNNSQSVNNKLENNSVFTNSIKSEKIVEKEKNSNYSRSIKSRTNNEKSINESNYSRSIKSRTNNEENHEKKNFKKKNLENDYLNHFLNQIRNKLNFKGVRSFLALKNQLYIMDDDKDLHLDYNEFVKAIKDFRIYLSDGDFKILFKELKDKEINKIRIDTFFDYLIKEPNEKRNKTINRVYEKLILKSKSDDKILVKDIKMNFSGRNHPDVRDGKKSEDELLAEFTDSLDLFCNLYRIKSGYFTQEDFIKYYKIVSTTIESDSYFDIILKNTWRLLEEKKREEKIEPAWQRPNFEEIRNTAQKLLAPFGVTNEKFQNETSNRKEYFPKNKNPNISDLHKKGVAAGIDTWPNYQPNQDRNNKETNDIKALEILEILKNILIKRGPRGIIGFYKNFFNLDDDNSKILNFYEFSEALNYFRINLDEKQKEILFNAFDYNNNKCINYDEFFLSLRGNMSSKRSNYLNGVFNSLSQGNEFINLKDFKYLFNSKNHPLVMLKERSEEEVLAEFLDLFEDHHLLFCLDYKMKKEKIYFNEFLSFNEIISLTIPDDKNYFNYLKAVWLNETSEYKSVISGRSINRSKVSRT